MTLSTENELVESWLLSYLNYSILDFSWTQLLNYTGLTTIQAECIQDANEMSRLLMLGTLTLLNLSYESYIGLDIKFCTFCICDMNTHSLLSDNFIYYINTMFSHDLMLHTDIVTNFAMDLCTYNLLGNL